MRKVRISYIPSNITTNNIIWPIMTMISFLIILILIILLVFSHLDSINNILEINQIEKQKEDAKAEFEKAKLDVTLMNEDLLKVKEELASFNDTDGKKLSFYNQMSTVKDVRENFADKLYNSLDTRSILKNYGDMIYINEKGNLSFYNTYLFTSEAILSENTKDMFTYLSKRLEEILLDNKFNKYVKNIVITVNDDIKEQEAAVLSLARANAFKSELIKSNKNLTSYEEKMLIAFNQLTKSDVLDDLEVTDNKDLSYIDIDIILDEKEIYNSIKELIDNKNNVNKTVEAS